MVKKFASLLSADATSYDRVIRKLEKNNFDGFHFDVMDGHFVKNFAFSANVIGSLRKLTKLPFQAHLEIENPEEYVDMFLNCGCSIISLHPQTCGDIERELRYIKSKNAVSSVAIDPDIEIDAIKNYLNLIDNVVVMTVYPGFGNQKFIEKSLDKIKDLKKIFIDNNLNITISVDGGVNKETSDRIIESGADILIYGSSLFKSNFSIKDF